MGIVVVAFCSGAAMSFFTLPLWVIAVINLAKDGSRSDWLGFYGAIIGGVITAVVAAAAIYFAWQGVTKQLRIGLVSREEDRIESELPGLKQAGDLLRSLELTFDPTQILERMEIKNLIVEGEFGISDLKNLVPDLNERSLRIIFSLLDRIRFESILFLHAISTHDRLQKEMITDLGTFPPDIIEQRKRTRAIQQKQLANHFEALKLLLGELRAYSTGIDLRVQRLADRQIAFRKEIEQFFDLA